MERASVSSAQEFYRDSTGSLRAVEEGEGGGGGTIASPIDFIVPGGASVGSGERDTGLRGNGGSMADGGGVGMKGFGKLWKIGDTATVVAVPGLGRTEELEVGDEGVAGRPRPLGEGDHDSRNGSISDSAHLWSLLDSYAVGPRESVPQTQSALRQVMEQRSSTIEMDDVYDLESEQGGSSLGRRYSEEEENLPELDYGMQYGEVEEEEEDYSQVDKEVTSARESFGSLLQSGPIIKNESDDDIHTNQVHSADGFNYNSVYPTTTNTGDSNAKIPRSLPRRISKPEMEHESLRDSITKQRASLKKIDLKAVEPNESDATDSLRESITKQRASLKEPEIKFVEPDANDAADSLRQSITKQRASLKKPEAIRTTKLNTDNNSPTGATMTTTTTTAKKVIPFSPPTTTPGKRKEGTTKAFSPITSKDWSQPTHVSREQFFGTRGDELSMGAGDLIHVDRQYEDGWCKAMNLSQGKKIGMVPIQYLKAVKGGIGPSKRVFRIVDEDEGAGTGVVVNKESSSSASANASRDNLVWVGALGDKRKNASNTNGQGRSTRAAKSPRASSSSMSTSTSTSEAQAALAREAGVSVAELSVLQGRPPPRSAAVRSSGYSVVAAFEATGAFAAFDGDDYWDDPILKQLDKLQHDSDSDIGINNNNSNNSNNNDNVEEKEKDEEEDDNNNNDDNLESQQKGKANRLRGRLKKKKLGLASSSGSGSGSGSGSVRKRQRRNSSVAVDGDGEKNKDKDKKPKEKLSSSSSAKKSSANASLDRQRVQSHLNPHPDDPDSPLSTFDNFSSPIQNGLSPSMNGHAVEDSISSTFFDTPSLGFHVSNPPVFDGIPPLDAAAPNASTSTVITPAQLLSENSLQQSSLPNIIVPPATTTLMTRIHESPTSTQKPLVQYPDSAVSTAASEVDFPNESSKASTFLSTTSESPNPEMIATAVNIAASTVIEKIILPNPTVPSKIALDDTLIPQRPRPPTITYSKTRSKTRTIVSSETIDNITTNSVNNTSNSRKRSRTAASGVTDPTKSQADISFPFHTRKKGSSGQQSQKGMRGSSPSIGATEEANEAVTLLKNHVNEEDDAKMIVDEKLEGVSVSMDVEPVVNESVPMDVTELNSIALEEDNGQTLRVVLDDPTPSQLPLQPNASTITPILSASPSSMTAVESTQPPESHNFETDDLRLEVVLTNETCEVVNLVDDDMEQPKLGVAIEVVVPPPPPPPPAEPTATTPPIANNTRFMSDDDDDDDGLVAIEPRRSIRAESIRVARRHLLRREVTPAAHSVTSEVEDEVDSVVVVVEDRAVESQVQLRDESDTDEGVVNQLLNEQVLQIMQEVEEEDGDDEEEVEVEVVVGEGKKEREVVGLVEKEVDVQVVVEGAVGEAERKEEGQEEVESAYSDVAEDHQHRELSNSMEVDDVAEMSATEKRLGKQRMTAVDVSVVPQEHLMEVEVDDLKLGPVAAMENEEVGSGSMAANDDQVTLDARETTPAPKSSPGFNVEDLRTQILEQVQHGYAKELEDLRRENELLKRQLEERSHTQVEEHSCMLLEECPNEQQEERFNEQLEERSNEHDEERSQEKPLHEVLAPTTFADSDLPESILVPATEAAETVEQPTEIIPEEDIELKEFASLQREHQQAKPKRFRPPVLPNIEPIVTSTFRRYTPLWHEDSRAACWLCGGEHKGTACRVGSALESGTIHAMLESLLECRKCKGVVSDVNGYCERRCELSGEVAAATKHRIKFLRRFVKPWEEGLI
ncbi:hypothetical protein HDU99_001948 [Rhizoclosmatium hyalinum]|nr:hypothetical protein HDU99_001948 [Rhizoclosmatium hyalinum]